MDTYKRIFGTGPRGLFISLSLLTLCIIIEKYFIFLVITEIDIIRYLIFGILSLIAIVIIIWSVKSLPPTDRGYKLITTGALKYFRHPLYGAFLSFFNFGLAVFLNNWIYVMWAVLQIPIWHWNVIGEEEMMKKEFPGVYEEYIKNTGRFFPKIF
jgi:protein-S-isoprenylcysteine O-methyltransferase Ste14